MHVSTVVHFRIQQFASVYSLITLHCCTTVQQHGGGNYCTRMMSLSLRLDTNLLDRRRKTTKYVLTNAWLMRNRHRLLLAHQSVIGVVSLSERERKHLSLIYGWRLKENSLNNSSNSSSRMVSWTYDIVDMDQLKFCDRWKVVLTCELQWLHCT